VPIPLDKWFHIEAFYHRSKNTSGKVIVWQDDDEIFNVNGNPTTLSDYPIYWSVNNYASNIQPNPCTIFVDDVSISTLPVGTK
jgi:hypothetical protein